MRRSGTSKSGGSKSFGAKIGSFLDSSGIGRALSGDPDGLTSDPVVRDYRHSHAAIKKARESNAVHKLVEFSFSCENLPKMDLLSDSDPFLVVLLADGVKKEVELLRSETVWDEQSPKFVHAMVLEPTESMTLRLEAYDRDRNSEKLSRHDFLGEAKVLASEVVKAGCITVPMFNRKGEHKNAAVVNVIACANPNVADLEYALEFSLTLASGIARRYTSSKDAASSSGDAAAQSRLFYAVSREVPAVNEWVAVYRSEVFSNKVAVNKSAFRLAPLSVGACCPNGDLSTKLRFEMFRYKPVGSHESCGAFVTSVKELEHLSTSDGVSREFMGSDGDNIARVELTGGFLSDEKMSFVFDVHLK